MDIEDDLLNKRNRQAFANWKVEAVYIKQDGACTRCGASLQHGFHRHHRDGNPANNTITNLELLCPSCHRATAGEPLNNYTERLRWAVASLSRLVEKALEGEAAGNVCGVVKEAIILALKYERDLAGLAAPESPPPSIVLMKKMQEQRILDDLYLYAFKVGFENGVKAVLEKKSPRRSKKVVVDEGQSI
jgi:hypothetical protein